MLPKQICILTIPAIIFLYRSLWAQKSPKQKFQTKVHKKKTKRIFPGHMLSQGRPEKPPPNFNLKRGDSKSSTDVDRQKQRMRHETWTVITAVFTKWPVIRGGPRPGVWYKHIWPLLCRKQATKILDPSPMAKNRPFFKGLGEESRTPWAASRPVEHGSTWYLGGRHLHSLALPDTKRVGSGLIRCRDQRPIVTWAVFCQRVDYFQPESTSSAACSSVNN